LSSNNLSGSIPAELGECFDLESVYMSDNVFTGTIPATFSQLEKLSEVDLSQNQFTGSIDNRLFIRLTKLTSIVLNDNLLTGKLPISLFQLPRLAIVVFAKNCFTATLPHQICNSPVLNQLILDGLHSASACSDRAIAGLPSSGLIAKNSVHGHIPSCFLQHKNL
jgi:Leucine-rich repeat (LRR) protein